VAPGERSVSTVCSAFLVISALANNAPDLGIVYAGLNEGPHGDLLPHRGLTHPLLLGPLLGVPLGAVALAILRRRGVAVVGMAPGGIAVRDGSRAAAGLGLRPSPGRFRRDGVRRVIRGPVAAIAPLASALVALGVVLALAASFGVVGCERKRSRGLDSPTASFMAP
jgi:hypothetical protein